MSNLTSPATPVPREVSGTRLSASYSSLAIPIHGYIWHPLALIVVITNTIICIVLLNKRMRSPTNVLLVAMAISDMLTAVFPVPIFIRFFNNDGFSEYLPYEWCYAVKVFSEFLPTCFHTASVWLTVALGVQRYICVCHPFKARVWCTMKRTVWTCSSVFFLAFVSHVCKLLDSRPVKVEAPSVLTPNTTVTSCEWVTQDWVKSRDNLFYNYYFWFRIVAISIVPCAMLSVLTILLIRTMRQAETQRTESLGRTGRGDCRNLRESTATSLMLVTVVCLFLLVEIPVAFFYVAHIIRNQYSNSRLFGERVRQEFAVLSNFVIFLSSPFNFVVYCIMSKKFRQSIKELFIRCSCTKPAQE